MSDHWLWLKARSDTCNGLVSVKGLKVLTAYVGLYMRRQHEERMRSRRVSQ
jgi:hypothetical protein